MTAKSRKPAVAVNHRLTSIRHQFWLLWTRKWRAGMQARASFQQRVSTARNPWEQNFRGVWAGSRKGRVRRLEILLPMEMRHWIQSGLGGSAGACNAFLSANLWFDCDVYTGSECSQPCIHSSDLNVFVLLRWPFRRQCLIFTHCKTARCKMYKVTFSYNCKFNSQTQTNQNPRELRCWPCEGNNWEWLRIGLRLLKRRCNDGGQFPPKLLA